MKKQNLIGAGVAFAVAAHSFSYILLKSGELPDAANPQISTSSSAAGQAQVSFSSDLVVEKTVSLEPCYTNPSDQTTQS